jgi:hypothetical protein
MIPTCPGDALKSLAMVREERRDKLRVRYSEEEDAEED